MAKEKEVVAANGVVVGGGLSKKEIRKIHERNMNQEEIRYLRRKEAMEKVWPVARFFILFGLDFLTSFSSASLISSSILFISSSLPRRLAYRIIFVDSRWYVPVACCST